MIRLVRCLLVVLLCAPICSAGQEAPPIIPLPQAFEHHADELDPQSLRSIVLGPGTSDGDRFAATLLRDELSKIGVDMSIDYAGPETRIDGSIRIDSAGLRGVEAYRLSITSSGAHIEGMHERGRFYGVMSMVQLVRSGDFRTVDIVDGPALALRGLVDDIVPQVPTFEELERTVRLLGEHKLNAYAFPVERIVGVMADSQDALLDSRELRGLHEVAASYHVEIIPILQSLGHLEHVLARPDFAPLSEFPGAASPNVQDSTVYVLVDSLVYAVVSAFKSDYVHIGGDASPEVGAGASAAAVDAEGTVLTQLRHYGKIADLVRLRGKKIMMNAELVVDAGIAEARRILPRDVMLIDGFSALPDTLRGRIEAVPLRDASTLFADDAVVRRHLSVSAGSALQYGAAGMLARTGLDIGEPVLRGTLYRKIAYAGDAVWNPDAGADVTDRFTRLHLGGDPDTFRAVERSVARFTEGLSVSEIWHHPTRRTVDGVPSDLPAGHMREAAARVMTEVEEMQANLERNADLLDYDAFALRFAVWHAEATELGRWMQRSQPPGPGGLEYGTAWARRLGGEARSLAQAFRSLWLRTNRERYLEHSLKSFIRQAVHFEHMADAMAAGRTDLPITLPSRYIRAATPNDASHLRSSFSLERGQIADAFLQIAGRNDVEAWVNGARIGRVVDDSWTDAHVWNVAGRLRSGENVLAIRARHRGADGPGSVNVYLEIHFEDGRTRRVHSGSTWKATGSPGPRWNAAAPIDDSWDDAFVVEQAPILSMPYFEMGLPSTVEH